MVNRKCTARRRRRMTLISGAAGLILIAILPIAWQMRSSEQLKIADITCEEAIQHLDGYIRGALSADLEASLSRHFLRCPHCEEVHQQRRKDLLGRLSPAGEPAFEPSRVLAQR